MNVEELYSVEELSDGVYAIDSVNEQSIYVLANEDETVFIDTGMEEGLLIGMTGMLLDREPYNRKLRGIDNDGKCSLILTHAHIDHMFHANEFLSRCIYISNEEVAAWKTLKWVVRIGELGYKTKHKSYNIQRYNRLKDGQRLTMAGRELQIIAAPGHTPGSIAIVDHTDRLVFMGDAVGSGEGSWMWMPGCSTISDYRKGLQSLMTALRGCEDYRYLGGHRMQGVNGPKHPKGHELNFGVIADMEELCGRLLCGQLSPAESEKQFGITIYRYEYKSAALWTVRSKI